LPGNPKARSAPSEIPADGACLLEAMLNKVSDTKRIPKKYIFRPFPWQCTNALTLKADLLNRTGE